MTFGVEEINGEDPFGNVIEIGFHVGVKIIRNDSDNCLCHTLPSK